MSDNTIQFTTLLDQYFKYDPTYKLNDYIAKNITAPNIDVEKLLPDAYIAFYYVDNTIFTCDKYHIIEHKNKNKNKNKKCIIDDLNNRLLVIKNSDFSMHKYIMGIYNYTFDDPGYDSDSDDDCGCYGSCKTYCIHHISADKNNTFPLMKLIRYYTYESTIDKFQEYMKSTYNYHLCGICRSDIDSYESIEHGDIRNKFGRYHKECYIKKLYDILDPLPIYSVLRRDIIGYII